MDFGTIFSNTFFLYFFNAIVGIKYFDIGMSIIVVVPIDKAVVFAFDGVIPDALSAGEGDLGTIVIDEKMFAALHDAMHGIVEEIIGIKTQDSVRR